MALTRPRIAQINTNITALTDAITVLNAGATSANVDSGFLINRAHGLISNAAIYYSETLDTFVTAFTSNSGGTDSNIVISSYVDFTTGNVFSTGISSTGNVDFRFSPNVNLGTVSNIIITGGQSGQILQTLGNGELTWVDNTPTTVTYTANSIALTGGVYVSGSITDIQTFGDYGVGNVYVLTDGSGSAPAWYVDIDFLGVTNFNRVVLNINYTQSSGHTIYVQLYNNTTSAWDSIGTYTGLGSYYAFALQVINDVNYINAGTVQLRLYHSNAGAISHQTSIDYAALELSNQGPQGPRGPTGATGATGSGVASGGTAGQILVKNSSTNYDTAWASNLTLANLNIIGIGDVSSNIGSYQTWANATIIATNAAIVTANTGMKSYVDDQIVSASGYGNTQVAAFLPLHTGNVSAANITATGNIVGGGIRNTVSSTPPANPVPGDTWYDTDNDTLLRYVDDGDSNQWVDISSVVVASLGGGYRYTASATAPGTATPGDNWYDTTTGILFRYVNDGAQSYWVDNSSIGLEIQTYGNTEISAFLLGNTTTGNIFSAGYYWANGAPFISSNYGNANVAVYLPTDSTIIGLQGNAAAQETAITDLRANIIAANAAMVTANTGIKSYVDGQITNLINSAPAILDTLGEIATALGNDANLSVTLTSLISNVQANVTSANSSITTANTGMQSYVDARLVTVNSNITTANTGMQSYVDARTYSNVNTAAYLAGNVTTGNLFTSGLYYANGTPYSTGGGTSTSAYMLSYIFGA